MPRCSLAASSFGFSSAWPNNSGSCCDLFLRQSALNPYPFGGFLWSVANRVTPIQGSDCDFVSIHIPTIIDGRLVKFINARFRLSLHIKVIQRSQNIDRRNKEFRPWSNMTPIRARILQKWCRASTSGLGSRASTFSSEFLLKWLPEVAPALSKAVDNSCPSGKISPVVHGNTNSTSFVVNFHFF